MRINKRNREIWRIGVWVELPVFPFYEIRCITDDRSRILFVIIIIFISLYVIILVSDAVILFTLVVFLFL